jgi:hypothetical protein
VFGVAAAAAAAATTAASTGKEAKTQAEETYWDEAAQDDSESAKA